MKFKPMTKQDLWQAVYIEAMRQGRMTDPKELADKAVKDYEERFEREAYIDPLWAFPKLTQESVDKAIKEHKK